MDGQFGSCGKDVISKMMKFSFYCSVFRVTCIYQDSTSLLPSYCSSRKPAIPKPHIPTTTRLVTSSFFSLSHILATSRSYTKKQTLNQSSSMSKYSEDPQWSDIVPLPTQEGGPNPLAAIAYAPEYEEAMSYLRAVMAANEYSERVLDLTEDVIDLNPAHYTVWLYRAATLFALKADLRAELEWVSETARAHQKNYQIWNHRMMVVGELGDCAGEPEFVEEMFGLDGKNYNVWSYRQWLTRKFDLWGQGEFAFVEKMLEKDVRNNSAWNYRWFLVNGREAEGVKGVTDPGIKRGEVDFAARAIEKAPQNPSPWNYLRGIAKKSEGNLKELKELASQYADISRPDGVRSSHALDVLADILADEDKQKAGEALDLLAITYDPIRKNYWEYRKGLLGLTSTATATAA